MQTHQYGGSTGVVVNSVTKSGTNNFAGRIFEYYQDNKLQATDYFLKQEGEKNPESGSNVYGGSIGGPIVRNKACDHTFKAGVATSRTAALPQGTAANFTGNYDFFTNANFSAADPRTYPRRFQLRMGQFDFDQIDRQASGFVQDKWQVNDRLTLNLGVRYDWQRAVKTKDAIGPRLGVAFDLTGDGKTLVRGGVGKVFQYQSLAVLSTLAQQAVIAPTFLYDTTQVTSPSITGVLPVKPGDPNATACLQPVGAATVGEAVLSPTCRTFLVGLRNQVNAGGFVNNQPTVDGDRRYDRR